MKPHCTHKIQIQKRHSGTRQTSKERWVQTTLVGLLVKRLCLHKIHPFFKNQLAGNTKDPRNPQKYTLGLGAGDVQIIVHGVKGGLLDLHRGEGGSIGDCHRQCTGVHDDRCVHVGGKSKKFCWGF